MQEDPPAGGTGPERLPTVEHMRKVVSLFSALARGDRGSIPKLTKEMTLEQGTLACFAVGELLMRQLVALSGKSVEDVAAQLALEIR
jgi:hypothetical protein